MYQLCINRKLGVTYVYFVHLVCTYLITMTYPPLCKSKLEAEKLLQEHIGAFLFEKKLGKT